MKKREIIILIVLSMILVAEGVLYFTSSKSYADISEKLKATVVDEENGTLLNCQNISIDGRNYTQLICQIKKGEVRIISLKTKDRELVIPNRILSGKGGRRKLDRNSGGTVDGGESAENRRSGRGILDGR